MDVGAGLHMFAVVVEKSTFAISSPDEFLSKFSQYPWNKLQFTLVARRSIEIARFAVQKSSRFSFWGRLLKRDTTRCAKTDKTCLVCRRWLRSKNSDKTKRENPTNIRSPKAVKRPVDWVAAVCGNGSWNSRQGRRSWWCRWCRCTTNINIGGADISFCTTNNSCT